VLFWLIKNHHLVAPWEPIRTLAATSTEPLCLLLYRLPRSTHCICYSRMLARRARSNVASWCTVWSRGRRWKSELRSYDTLQTRARHLTIYSTRTRSPSDGGAVSYWGHPYSSRARAKTTSQRVYCWSLVLILTSGAKGLGERFV